MVAEPCVFEAPNAELREGTLIAHRKALNFDMGLNFEQKCRRPACPGPKPLGPGPAWAKHDGHLAFCQNRLEKQIQNPDVFTDLSQCF